MEGNTASMSSPQRDMLFAPISQTYFCHACNSSIRTVRATGSGEPICPTCSAEGFCELMGVSDVPSRPYEGLADMLGISENNNISDSGNYGVTGLSGHQMTVETPQRRNGGGRQFFYEERDRGTGSEAQMTFPAALLRIFTDITGVGLDPTNSDRRPDVTTTHHTTRPTTGQHNESGTTRPTVNQMPTMMHFDAGEGPNAGFSPAALFFQLHNALTSDNFVNDDAIQHIIQMMMDNDPNRQGAPPTAATVLRGLVTKTLGVNAESEGDCAVCQEVYTEGDVVCPLRESADIFKPEDDVCNCTHTFHESCIRPWLERHNSCPVCRYELPTDDLDYESRKADLRRRLQQRPGS